MKTYKKQSGIAKEQLTADNQLRNAAVDHLGNEYGSTLEMCKAYSISYRAFNYRLKHGSTLKEALTSAPYMGKKYTPCNDHLGNRYNSQAEMAHVYGLTTEQYLARKRIGWDVERILTTPVGRSGNRQGFEFNGTTYSSKKEFCKKEGINYKLFIQRTNAGMSIEEAFAASASRKRDKCAVDHTGKQYATIKEMCKFYGISVSTYKHRLSQGLTLKAVLTNPPKPGLGRKEAIDHKGMSYPSISDMCDAYGLSYATYKYRLDQGGNVEQALTTPINSFRSRVL